MEGKRKKINMVNPFNKPLIPIGELTILAEPVLTVKKSKTPAALAAKNKANNKKTPKYI